MRTIAEFIGDEVTAAGYRLCGIDTQVADDASVLVAIEAASQRTSLVLVGSSLSAALSTADLDALSRRSTPPVLIVDDMKGEAGVPDIVSRIRRQLGMLE